MAIVPDNPPQARFANVQARLIDYASRVEQLQSPDDVLDELNTITTQSMSLSVLGAARLPSKSGDWESSQVGKSAFLHKDIPEGWWEEFSTLDPDRFHPIAFLATTSMTSYTWTEIRRMLEPIGVERLKYDLELKYGMRSSTGRDFYRRQLCGTTPGAGSPVRIPNASVHAHT